MNLNQPNTSLIYQSTPTLTGNVKVVVDSEDIYLNSIHNGVNLGDVRLQKYKIHKDWTYAEDVANFWSQGNGIFNEEIHTETTASLMTAGPSNNINTYFRDVLSYFAPLWFNGYIIPDYFLIFKVDDFEFEGQEITDFVSFATNSLYTSKIVSTHSLMAGSKLGDYIRQSSDNIPTSSWSIIDSTSVLISGIDLKNGTQVEFKITVEDSSLTTDAEVLALYKEYGMASPKLINLEFLFSDGTETVATKYYGAYFTRDEASQFKIDINKHNLELDVPIRDKYITKRSNFYPLTNKAGVKLHVGTWDTNISNYFDYSCDPTGTDTEFTYNPFCPGYFWVDDIEYGEDFGLTDPESLNYGLDVIIGSSELAVLDYWLYCSYDYNYLTLASGQYFYALEDVNKRHYGVKSFGEDITLADTEGVNLEDFYGIDNSRNKQIPGRQLFTEGHDNLKISFNRTSINKIFYAGDYMKITCNITNKIYEWRVYTDFGSCCGSNESGYYEPPKLKFKSCDIQFTRYSNSVMLEAVLEEANQIEEGDKIYLTCAEFKNKEFTVDKIVYDHDKGTNIIWILDLYGDNFRKCLEVDVMEFNYTGSSYYFSYFDPRGTLDEIGKKLEYAFNLFSNRLFDVVEYENEIILKSKYSGNKFSFEYHFEYGQTHLPNISINGKVLNGTNVLDSHKNVLMTRKRGNIEFFGKSKVDKGVRFVVDKTWANDNLTGLELISTRHEKVPLVQKYFEGNFHFYSNYLETPISYDSTLLRFQNLENYVVLQVPDDKPPIYESSSGMIGANYEFFPKMIKFILTPQNDI